jgi:cell division protein FtsI (penicillin-binding protein 3)
VRLFYLQIIRHDYYRKAAYQGQYKEYEIPAERGVIEAHDGDRVVPIVLNEKKYTLFADPKYIKEPREVADEVQKIIGGNTNEYEEKMRASSRYAVLAKKLGREQRQKLDDLDIKGLGTREESYRTYPQGQLAAQVLGFVNDEGEGKYGIEQALQGQLKGTPGQLKAITDAKGVPLVANKDNVSTAPKSGKRVVLTIDISMQQQVEELLKKGLDRAKSGSGSVIVMDATTGAVKAMANYPTYNPAEFYKVEDGNVFNNAGASAPLEVGSVMKPLTAAAALDIGAVSKNTTYYDPSRFQIGDAVVKNIEEDGGPGTKSIADILQLSLNTGAVYLLKQMGGGEINEKARKTWHDYMVNHYHFGKATGIEQGFEADGYVPDPVEGYGLQIQYANTSFGQGMTATPLQMAAAEASIINGGTYYRPRLIDRTIDGDGIEQIQQPQVLKTGVIKPEVSQTLREFMEYTLVKNRYSQPRTGIKMGGKTGTAQVIKPGGGYYDDRFNGMFMGYLGVDVPKYVIVVRVNEPKIAGYAGSKAAAPLFSDVANMIVDNFPVTTQ